MNLRNSPRFSDRSSRNEPNGKRLEFDAWTYGETGTDMWTGQPDNRWFKIKGTNLWVPSAYIYGNPPNSSPMPGSGAIGDVKIGGTPINNTPTVSDPNGTLSTATDWGNFNDRTDSIGFNGDQNDFFRFRVTDNRTNVNLTLSGLSADADLELIRDWNNNGQRDPEDVIVSSVNSGTKVDSVSRILEPGDYFVRVFPGTPSAKTNYNLQLKSVPLAGQIQNNRPNNNAVDLYRYGIVTDRNGKEVLTRTDIGIESSKDTIVVVHGRGDSSEGSNIKALLEAATRKYPNHQVLALDWNKAAQDKGQPPLTAARSIAPVANWAKNVLAAIGLTSERISLFGHSLGSYVSAEIGKLFGKVENLVAIDPAWPGFTYDIDEKPGFQGITEFQHTAKNSLAFVVKEDGFGSIAGSGHAANKAHNSLVISYEGWANPLNANDPHNIAVNVVADAVSKGYFRLDNSLALPSGLWKDKYGDSGNYVKWTGTHEGRVTATRDGKIKELAYISGSSWGIDIERKSWNWG